jgi:hypothetical protein
MKLTQIIDGAIEVFSPKSAIERRHVRAALDRVKKRSETYAAAKSDHLTGGWTPLNSKINDIVGASNPIMRARVQQLVRDFPFFKRAADALVEYSVGSGIIFQSKILDKKGDLNKKLIQQVEDEFNYWNDVADFSVKMSYLELMALAKKQDVESGEFFIIKQMVRDKKRRNPFALQMIEPEWISGGEKQEGDPYTLEDTGAFYKSMFITVYKDLFEINANPEKEDVNLFEAYGSGIIGLTDVNLSILIGKIKIHYLNYAKKILLGT